MTQMPNYVASPLLRKSEKPSTSFLLETWKNTAALGIVSSQQCRAISTRSRVNKQRKPPKPVPTNMWNPSRKEITLGRDDKWRKEAVVDRFMRLHNGLWIRTRAGREKFLWRKSPRRKHRLQQHVFCNTAQCRLLDNILGNEDSFKQPNYFVNDPYAPYHKKTNLQMYRNPPRKWYP